MPSDDETAIPARTAPPADRRIPSPAFGHLRHLTDRAGLWEHALLSTPRAEHGYCTDDNARALVVVSRQASSSGGLADLAATYLGFVLEARTDAGGFHNRRHADGSWTDQIGSDDSQGRAWWGLGAVAHRGAEPWMRTASADAFAASTSFGSPHLRANAYAALGATEMLAAHPGHVAATDLARRAGAVIAAAARQRIPWPEPQLTYDNARLPEALMATGEALGDHRLTSAGIRLLGWLVAAETLDGRFSFTPSGGRSPGDGRPGFDQQPIEAAAMADACHRAWTITGEERWRSRALGCARWLMGDNDTDLPLYDEATGETSDGLMAESVNQNRGAESTLAGISVLQVAGWCVEDRTNHLI